MCIVLIHFVGKIYNEEGTLIFKVETIDEQEAEIKANNHIKQMIAEDNNYNYSVQSIDRLDQIDTIK
jgi:hypothetical protein